EAEASASFWDRDYKLHDLEMVDADRHARLLAAIHALDMACAHEDPHEIAVTGKAAVREWKGVVRFMCRKGKSNEQGAGLAKSQVSFEADSRSQIRVFGVSLSG